MFSKPKKPRRSWRLIFRVAAASVIVFATDTSARAAFLEGHLMQVGINFRPLQDPGSQPFGDHKSVTVGPEVELPGFGKVLDPPTEPLVDVDIADESIRITLVRDQPTDLQMWMTFSDVQQSIPPMTNVTVDPQTTWAGFDQSHVGPDHLQVITLVFDLLAGLNGQQVYLNVLPEPAAGASLIMGITALISFRRRAARSAPVF